MPYFCMSEVVMKAIIYILCIVLCHSLHAIDYWKGAEYYENSSSQKEAASDLMKCVSFSDPQNILDIGCGDGKITAELAAKVPNGSVMGIDISPSMIDFAKEHFNLPNLQFSIKDAQQIDYEGEFDTIFSFTALHWVKSHESFLESAYRALKPGGTLAVTMPMGLPHTMEQAVNEIIALPQWAPYFAQFSTGWNFVEAVDYADMAANLKFSTCRIAVVPQKDIYPSREAFEKFIWQFFPYLRALPEEKKKTFFTQVVDRYLELETPFPNGEVHFKFRRLEVVVTKP